MSDETPPEPGIDFAALAAPFDPAEIHWRVGSVSSDEETGMALAYLDARDVMDRLDAVCGPENWTAIHRQVDGRNICTLSVRVRLPDGSWDWVAKEDGAGDTDIESEKGGLSDALKRAGVLWGIGRYLYRLGTTWVKVEGPNKQRKRIMASEMPRLSAILATSAGPVPPSNDPPPADDPPKEPGFSLPTPVRKQLDECVRYAGERIAEIQGHPFMNTDERVERSKELCAELGAQIRVESEPWTLPQAKALKKALQNWTGPVQDSTGSGFGDDPPLCKNAEKNKALHALAKEVRPNGDSHTLVHQAAEMIGYKSYEDVQESRYGDMRRELNGLEKT